MTPDSVSPRHARRQLGKTRIEAVQGGGVAKSASLSEGNHPQPIPPCRYWFALFVLCKL